MRRLARVLPAALGLGALLAGGTGLPADAAPKPSPVTEVVPTGLADPGLLKVDDTYYLYGTGKGFPWRSSTNPTGAFATSGPSMIKRPKWMPKTGAEYWAPHVFAVTKGGATTFVMYFAGSAKTGDRRCIGSATAASPTGPFEPAKKPLKCGPTGNAKAIDPAHFTDKTTKKSYLIYKLRVGNRYEIRAVRVNQVGTSLKAGTDIRLLSGGGRNVEAPSLVRHGGRIWMFVSVNDYRTCDYRTKVSSASKLRPNAFGAPKPLSIRDPEPKAAERFCGPGGAEVIQDGNTWRIAFHAWAKGKDQAAGGTRTAWMGEIRWRAKTGQPYVPARG